MVAASTTSSSTHTSRYKANHTEQDGRRVRRTTRPLKGKEGGWSSMESWKTDDGWTPSIFQTHVTPVWFYLSFGRAVLVCDKMLCYFTTTLWLRVINWLSQKLAAYKRQCRWEPKGLTPESAIFTTYQETLKDSFALLLVLRRRWKWYESLKGGLDLKRQRKSVFVSK